MSLFEKDGELEEQIRKEITPKELFPTILGLIVFVLLTGILPLFIALSLLRNGNF